MNIYDLEELIISGNVPKEKKKRRPKTRYRYCAKCKTTENLTRDHVVPKLLLKVAKRYGVKVNTEGNWQILCKKCNEKKGHKLETKRAKKILKEVLDKIKE